MESYRFQDAQRSFQLIRDQTAPGTETWRKATLGLAVTYQQDPAASAENTAKAKSLHEAVWNADPSSREAAAAALALARIAHLRDYYQDAIDLPEARGWYRKALAVPGIDDQFRLQVVSYLATSSIEELTQEGFLEAQKVLVQALSERPSHPLSSVLWNTLADLRQYYLQDYAGAVEALRQVDRLGAPSTVRWKTVWRMGSLAEEKLGDRPLAVACYRKIITKYMRSGRSDMAADRLRALGVEPPPMAKTLWEQQGDPGPVDVEPLAENQRSPKDRP